MQTWKSWAQRLKTELYALYLAYRDPRTPWYARVLAALVVAYAFSPLDLIPDPIPVLGYLDDLLLLPLGIWLVLRLIPAEVMADSRLAAQARIAEGKPVMRLGLALVLIIWGLGLVLVGWWLWKSLKP
jgi:uncharacterized membrane protein YkvA (DUF1232 family)